MKKLLYLMLVVMILLASCTSYEPVPDETNAVSDETIATCPAEMGIHYYYDEVHDVGVWAVLTRGGQGIAVAIAVLPSRDVLNPHKPMAKRAK